jgi:hypothetical protein
MIQRLNTILLILILIYVGYISMRIDSLETKTDVVYEELLRHALNWDRVNEFSLDGNKASNILSKAKQGFGAIQNSTITPSNILDKATTVERF